MADGDIIKEKSLSTYDFVNATLRDLYYRAREYEISLLQDRAGDIKAEFAEPVSSCPVCGQTRFELLFIKQGFRIVRCLDTDRCGHVFANPQIKEQALMNAYRGQGGPDSDQTPANDIWIEVLLSEANHDYDRGKYLGGLYSLEEVLPNSNEPRRLLDIGCSIGHFLSLARKKGWHGIGLELNEKAVNHARNVLKLDVRTQLLDEAGFAPESFDAVTLWGVMEHLKRPMEVLRQIHRILKPGGLLLTFCPNATSLVCRVLREQAATFDGRNHPSYFTPTSLRRSMSLAGFETIKMTFHQADLDAVLNYVEGRNPYVRTTEHIGPFREFFSGLKKQEAERFILENGYGYKMMTLNIKAV